MDRDDLASLDHLSEPQAADERIDVPLDRHGGGEQADHVDDERVDVGKRSSDADVGADPGHGRPPSGADEPSGGPAAPPAVSSSPSIDEITVLACRLGKRAAKRWSRGPDGSPVCEGYDAGTFFHVQAYRVRDISSLHRFLLRIATDPASTSSAGSRPRRFGPASRPTGSCAARSARHSAGSAWTGATSTASSGWRGRPSGGCSSRRRISPPPSARSRAGGPASTSTTSRSRPGSTSRPIRRA